MAQTPATIYIVDDDEPVRQGLALLFEAAGFNTELFPGADEFLAAAEVRCTGPGCIVLDQHMPGMTGLEVQHQLSELSVRLPIIFLSGHGTVSTAVQALQDGAVDFVEKPFDSDTLLDKVTEAVQRYRDTQMKAQECLDLLTRREREVLDHIVAGKANKVIAQELRISERTVELHRGRMMRKMGVHNVAQLLRLLSPAETS